MTSARPGAILGSWPSTPHDDAAASLPALRSFRRWRSGGTRGNELLTSSIAVLLIALLAAEGVTLLNLRPLVDEHMFIGLVLIPPVLLKLSSVGYRFVRYCTGARAYDVKGAPRLPLRMLAPVLVAATIALFASGELMLSAGHRSQSLLQIHQLSAIVWTTVFAVHVLAYIPRVVRSLASALRATREARVPGSGRRPPAPHLRGFFVCEAGTPGSRGASLEHRRVHGDARHSAGAERLRRVTPNTSHPPRAGGSSSRRRPVRA